MTIFLYNGVLSGSVRPQKLSKSMPKLTGLHSIFRKNSIYGANIGFMHSRSQGPSGDGDV